MKTLEDKAQEYSVMSGALDAGYSTETEEAYRQGAREAQHWFSVSKELPDTSDFGVSENVILKLSVYNKKLKKTYECCIEAYYDSDIEHWFFMLPVDIKNLKLEPLVWRPIERR